MKRFIATMLFMVVFYSGARASIDETVLAFDPVGKIALYQACARPNNVVIFIPGDGNWTSLDQVVSSGMGEKGIPVAGLNTLSYLRTFARRRSLPKTWSACGGIIRHSGEKSGLC